MWELDKFTYEYHRYDSAECAYSILLVSWIDSRKHAIGNNKHEFDPAKKYNSNLFSFKWNQ